MSNPLSNHVFGIDLGTTNSLIGVEGELITGLVSSSIDIEKRKQVSRDTTGENVIASYKVDMGMGESGQLPITCSSIVLKKLSDMAERRYGERPNRVIISVPAYFSTSQREAVYEAAKQAGLNLLNLINEPVAAALHICKTRKALVVIYDLGGGTFDVTIVDSRSGKYGVIATDGNNIGGDDLDQAIVNEIIKCCKVPVRYRTEYNKKVMMVAARKAKEEIQRMRKDVYVNCSAFKLEKDFLLTVETYKRLIRETFGDTFNMTNYLISTNIPSNEKPEIIYTGGSSMCPYLKEMLYEEIELEELKYDDVKPDMLVAAGVTSYAHLVEQGKAQNLVQDVTKRLCIEKEDGSTIDVIDANSFVPCSNTIVVENPKETDKLVLKLYQGDSFVAAENEYIGSLVYDYDRMVEAGEGIISIKLNVSFDGVITMKAGEVIYGDEFMTECKFTLR